MNTETARNAMQLHALECMPRQQERMLVCDQAAARSGPLAPYLGIWEWAVDWPVRDAGRHKGALADILCDRLIPEHADGSAGGNNWQQGKQ
jgi:hypothetical protein